MSDIPSLLRNESRGRWPAKVVVVMVLWRLRVKLISDVGFPTGHE